MAIAKRRKITILVKNKKKYEKNWTFGQTFRRYKKNYCNAYEKKKTMKDIMQNEGYKGEAERHYKSGKWKR